MKVKDLIEVLQDMDPNAEVVAVSSSYDGSFETVDIAWYGEHIKYRNYETGNFTFGDVVVVE